MIYLKIINIYKHLYTVIFNGLYILLQIGSQIQQFLSQVVKMVYRKLYQLDL